MKINFGAKFLQIFYESKSGDFAHCATSIKRDFFVLAAKTLGISFRVLVGSY